MHKHIAPGALLHFSISKCREMRLQLEDQTPVLHQTYLEAGLIHRPSARDTILRDQGPDYLEAMQIGRMVKPLGADCQQLWYDLSCQLTRNRKSTQSVYASFLVIISSYAVTGSILSRFEEIQSECQCHGTTSLVIKLSFSHKLPFTNYTTFNPHSNSNRDFYSSHMHKTVSLQ